MMAVPLRLSKGDGVCGQLGQHCCCYDAKKDDM